MRKIFISFLIGVFILTSKLISAKEGMWLPILLQKLNADEMQAMGMRISAEEIYSLEKSSLKDAIVHFGGGCTAELVSSQGLLLTNHHCGYRSIQKHSTLEHDYLTDGFWAPKMSDELPNPGLTAKIMTSMIDVSDFVLDSVLEGMPENQRQKLIANHIARLKKQYDNDQFHQVQVKAFYYGNQYILMTYDVFYDVRLVGAPPSNIGKFGGDTDNWMWPRHTGDFSVFRIYANDDNQPVDYNKNNRPYEPRQHLKISLRGVEEGDFTMVFGYPGRTQEYLPSYALEEITEKVNPFRIELRRQKLDIMAEAMNKSPQIRIQYSAKYAGVANGWKKWIGENKGIKRMNAVQIKKEQEKSFLEWRGISDSQDNNIINDFENAYAEFTNWDMAYYYFVETSYYHDLSRYVGSYSKLVELSKEEKLDTAMINKEIKRLSGTIDGFFKDYDKDVDKALFLASVRSYAQFSYDAPMPEVYSGYIHKKFKGDMEKYTDFVYSKSFFNDAILLKDFLADFSPSKVSKIEKDPMYAYVNSVKVNFQDSILPPFLTYQHKIDSLQHLYMDLIMQKRKGELIYPDANSTLRIAYGKVESYEPRDGVKYNYFTTLSGIMAKENPNIYDYVVEPRLKELYDSKDYERYADKDGKMHVCFIASNHTTGGNSGSPVLNADGHLIGLNFDRNWEGTMSDLMYDPDQCRNITLDVRYCLFIIDKFANARRLIDEMDLVE
ncbi:MAG: serine protease [Bacteroidetes bacterium]|nr:MAG: serine protease [Bacteroidota bacterium]